MIWALEEAKSDEICDTPIRAWVWVYFAAMVWSAFFQKAFILVVLKYNPAADGAVMPARVKAYYLVSLLFLLSWNTTGYVP